jgi:hypothetical protein
MKKIVFLPFLLLILSCNYKDNGKKKNGNGDSEMFRFERDSLILKKIEKQDDVLKDKFIKANISEFKNEYEAYNTEFHSAKDLKKDLYVYDFNADGRDDLIFTGQSGGEPYEVAFILNTSSGFKLVFKSFQYIWNLGFDHHKISTIYINDDGCCDAYIDFNKIYHADYSKGKPQFNLTYLTANVSTASIPKKYLSKPIYFEIIKNNYKLRSAPKIDDIDSVSYGGGDVQKGNTIGLLASRTKGRAIAAERDSAGRIWWLVELNPETLIKESVFYEDESSKRVAGKMGWISSRYVKVVN